MTSDGKKQQPKQSSTEEDESVSSAEKTNRLSEPALLSTQRNQKSKPFEQNEKQSELATSPSNKREKQPETDEDPESSSGKKTKPTKPAWSSKQNNIPTSITGFASNPGLP